MNYPKRSSPRKLHKNIRQNILTQKSCVNATESIDIAIVMDKDMEPIVRGFQSAREMKTSDCLVVWKYNGKIAEVMLNLM